MGRYSYDDMPPEGYRERRRNGRMTGVLASIGIVLTLLAVVLYLLFSPAAGEETQAETPSDEVQVTHEEPSMLTASALAEQPEPEKKEDVPPADIVPSSGRYPAIEYTEYAVAEGDTLQSIADAFSVTLGTLSSVNRLSDANPAPGTVISIPPVNGVLHTMTGNETLESVAAAFNPELSAADLASLNGKENTAVESGEDIFIPSPGTLDSAISYLFSSPLPGGTVASGFGELFDGRQLDGVILTADPGSAVVAAADGSILDIYSDPVYGRSVSVLHEGGYVTTYSGLEIIGVSGAKQVSKGEVIGAIGTSSVFGKPAVLFSIKQNSVPLDPVNLTEF